MSERVPHRIIIIGPSWVGDMVMTQSMLITLRRRFPLSQIDVLAPAFMRPLLQRMPEVSEAMVSPFSHGELNLIERYRFARQLRRRQYDWCIVVPNSIKAALIPLWAGIPRRTGYRGENRWGLINDMRKPSIHASGLLVERLNHLALPEGAARYPDPVLMADSQNLPALLKREGLSVDQPVIGLCPGAEYGPAKRWPLDYFADIARAKSADGWTAWIFGGQKDMDLAEQLCRKAGRGCVNLAGRTSLGEVVDLLTSTTVVVTNDSGLMHIAAATGRNIVALFGSTDPGYTPPLTSRARILTTDINCRPCFSRECRFEHLQCLWNIVPSRVLNAINEFEVSGSRTTP